MKLYTFFRSSAAYRVRIALNLKGLKPEMIPVHLVKHGGEQHAEAYRKLNPNEVVPTLVDGDAIINQSLAIMEYLDEVYPQVRLLPNDPVERAHVRAIALTIACDIHPIQNLRVLRYLKSEFGFTEEQRNHWYRHWVSTGLAAVERMVTKLGGGDYCFGHTPTIADACLIPQMFNARRVDTDLSMMPNLLRIEANCQKLDAFRDAAPANQADAE